MVMISTTTRCIDFRLLSCLLHKRTCNKSEALTLSSWQVTAIISDLHTSNLLTNPRHSASTYYSFLFLSSMPPKASPWSVSPRLSPRLSPPLTPPKPFFSQLVELKSGETYNGHLVDCDTFMNVTLRDVYLTSPDGEKFWKLKEVYIRGNVVSPLPRA